MKRMLLLPAMLLSLALAGCGAGSKLGGFIDAATTTITNPVDATDIYRAKTVYAASLEGATGYRQFCWSKPYAVLMKDPVARPICRNRRSIVRQMQDADEKAFAAIERAEIFVRNNPTLNAANLIGAAWTAVTTYQNLAARYIVAAR